MQAQVLEIGLTAQMLNEPRQKVTLWKYMLGKEGALTDPLVKIDI